MSSTPRDVSRLVSKKLENYMNRERREGKFDLSGQGYGTTKNMWQYDVLYRVLETTVLDKKRSRGSTEDEGQEKATGKSSLGKGIQPRLQANSRRVVTNREADRLTNYAKEVFEQQPLNQLEVLHRYRPKHVDNIKDIPENGKVQNYTQHVGSCLHSQRYVNYYVNQGLQTGKKAGAVRLQKLKSPGAESGKSAKSNPPTQELLPKNEGKPRYRSALRGKGEKGTPKTVKFETASTGDKYRAENIPLIGLKLKDDSTGSQSSSNQVDVNLIDDSYEDDVFEDDDKTCDTGEEEFVVADNMNIIGVNNNQQVDGGTENKNGQSVGFIKPIDDDSDTSQCEDPPSPIGTNGREIEGDEERDYSRNRSKMVQEETLNAPESSAVADRNGTSFNTFDRSSTCESLNCDNKSVCTYVSVEHVTEV